MTVDGFFCRLRRIIIITGHYGSGKTEFAVSLAMHIGAKSAAAMSSTVLSTSTLSSAALSTGPVTLGTAKNSNLTSCALIDLDIVNPYFRSRERRDMLENAGISVYGSVYEEEITVELPALGASLRAPLEAGNCRVIVDTGGNDAGAMILNQFTKYFTDDDTTVLAVINANRPDTSDAVSALEHITAIEKSTGLTVSGLVNNTHLLRETTADDIIEGHALCAQVCELTGKPLFCNCYPEGLIDPNELKGLSEYLMPLGLYMRPTWLDK